MGLRGPDHAFDQADCGGAQDEAAGQRCASAGPYEGSSKAPPSRLASHAAALVSARGGARTGVAELLVTAPERGLALRWIVAGR